MKLQAVTRIATFASLLASACTATPLDSPESSVGSRAAPIVGGTTHGGDPAVVLLILGGLGSCTGTLVAPDVILTARHCVIDVAQGDIDVYFDLPGGSRVRKSSLSHAYSPDGDIAIVRLAETTPDGVFPVPVGRESLTTHTGEAVRLVGYGVTTTSGSDSGVKRLGFTNLGALGGEGDDIMFIGSLGQSTCFGDSGGPDFMTFGGIEFVVGVNSFVTGGCGMAPAGSVRTDKYIAWLDQYFDTRFDKVPPTVSIVSPGEGESTAAGFIVVVEAADNLNLTKVELYIDEVYQSVDRESPYELTSAPNLPSGAHGLEVRAYDSSGNTTSATAQVTVAPNCAGDADCGGDETCANGICSGAIGAGCEGGSECASGQCFIPPAGSTLGAPFCTTTCGSDSECPDGFACTKPALSPIKKCMPAEADGCTIGAAGRGGRGAGAAALLAALVLSITFVSRRRARLDPH